MTHGLNLARRPFVDTRPANVAATFLGLLVVALTVVSVRTLDRYRQESAKTREAIAGLNAEIGRLDEARRSMEARLARFDVDELAASAGDAGIIARRRAFSWSRFLTRLEETLPADVRVTTINLSARNEAPKGGHSVPSDAVDVALALVCRDPDGLPKIVRAFYSSPHFDNPAPHSEDVGDKGSFDGRRLAFTVTYRDAGGAAVPAASGATTPAPDPKRMR